MKKTLLVLIGLTSISLFSEAQNTRFGFTGGAVFANYNSKVDGESDNGKSKVGITAGLLVDIPLGEHFSIQPALNFVQKGTKEEETFGGVTEKTSVNINCIEVPLNFLYNATGNTGNFFIGAGPSLAFAISGKVKYDDGTNSLSEDLKFGNSDEDDIKSLDLGANFITGYCFPNGLMLAVNYNMGLSNLIPGGDADATLKSSYFGIKLGFILNNKNSNK